MIAIVLRRRHGAAVSLCLSFTAAQAQSLAQLDPVVVTAARIEQRLAEALPHTTVITRADIERQQANDLLALLAQYAGVEFARSGAFGAQASLFVRGTNSSQTLVLIDGMRLNTAVGGAAALGGVSLDTVERIEIVRGNLSSLYGSEAIGGVIQIFTRRDAPGARAAIEAGYGATRAASASAGARLGSTEIAASAGGRRARPYSAIDAARVAGAHPDEDENRNRSGALRVRHAFERVELAASAWTSRNDTDFDDAFDGPTVTHRERSRQELAQVEARWRATDRFSTRLQAGTLRDDSRNSASDPFSFNNGEFRARNRQFAWNSEFAAGADVGLYAGIEQLDQRGTSTSYGAFERRVRAGWAGTVARRDAHRLQLNLRRDDYSDIGGATTGLVAYGYQVTPGWRLNAQYSTAFRAPSFNDLYFPFFGNPQLAPERARSVELGARYAAAAESLRLALYRTRTRDLIAFDPAAGRAQNIARAEIDGAELAFATQRFGWRIDGGIDASRPVDAATGQRLLRRAPYRIHLAAARDFGAFEVGAAATRVAARYDSDINTFARTRLAPYTLARAFAALRLGANARATLRIENLTDERYELVSGYNTPRRGAFVGLEARL
jgi:vitamin B12 transporter